MKKILLLRPRGFCAGVVRAIDIVKIALEVFGPPIYVRKEIVHNLHVVEELSSRGAIFVDSCLDVPHGGPHHLQRARSRSSGSAGSAGAPVAAD